MIDDTQIEAGESNGEIEGCGDCQACLESEKLDQNASSKTRSHHGTDYVGKI